MSDFATKLLPMVKKTLRQADNEFDDEIGSYIDTVATDLQDAGIHYSFFSSTKPGWVLDGQILQACRWYALSVFGLYNPDMEKYALAYASLKATLATQKRYTVKGQYPTGYEEGYTQGDLDGQAKGRAEGEVIGFANALAKLTDLVVTENGEYTPSGESTGFKSVSVSVPKEGEDRLNLLLRGVVNELIPEDFKEMTEVPAYAFIGDVNYPYKEFPKIKKATLPENIVSIGEQAFSYNKTLTSIIIKSEDEVTIGSNAFSNAKALTTVEVVGTISVGSYGFYECSSLVNIDTSKIVYFDEYSLYKCTALKSVCINTNRTVNRYSFSGCTSLENIVFGDYTISLGMGAFSSCTSLKSLVIPSNVNHTGYNVFSSCTSLESVDFYNRFGNNAFQNCTALKYVRVRATTPPSISSTTFNGCAALEKITVPIGSGDAYKSATNWSAYADIIVEEAM